MTKNIIEGFWRVFNLFMKEKNKEKQGWLDLKIEAIGKVVLNKEFKK